MKVSMIALTLAACVVGSVAHAAVPAPSTAAVDSSQIAQAAQPQWSASTHGAVSKTRAQVRRELVQAEKDGQLANLNRSIYMGS
jgi:Skp family chaperone for outer membrane proteins